MIVSSISSPRIIKKGRAVKILARLNGARAVADGILLEDGAVGDWVKVRRADNKKAVFRAKIINDNFVEVVVN